MADEVVLDGELSLDLQIDGKAGINLQMDGEAGIVQRVGRDPIIEPISIMKNGVYIPEAADGYNPVTVAVPYEVYGEGVEFVREVFRIQFPLSETTWAPDIASGTTIKTTEVVETFDIDMENYDYLWIENYLVDYKHTTDVVHNSNPIMWFGQYKQLWFQEIDSRLVPINDKSSSYDDYSGNAVAQALPARTLLKYMNSKGEIDVYAANYGIAPVGMKGGKFYNVREPVPTVEVGYGTFRVNTSTTYYHNPELIDAEKTIIYCRGELYRMKKNSNVIRKENEDGYNTFYDMMHEVGNG